MIFVDTSAFYALLDGDDSEHSRAWKLWEGEPPGEGGLATTNYIVLESMALLQSRLGMPAVRVFHDAILPLVRIEWIDEVIHAQAVSAFIAADRRGLSLVDQSSFETMRRLEIRSAFTFDRHFRKYGFETVP
ncbi:type II toxin-antitoxin system VapC family toxin [Candidatus Deferrimicrobium sp.]|uniref:type II toxin-antitoxin system VapC family toxin n=1 Tax=Candidatus Deferrimicrobium sp. TaxID=3060586 RepID=UPI002EDA0229